MPDFTYHPIFKPLLFQLSPELARRVTLGLLSLQARTGAGRALFRAFARAEPPPAAEVEAFGLRFPSPVGLAPGIDIDGCAAPVMQHLGFGYLSVGPAGSKPSPHRTETEPLRIPERRALVRSEHAGAPAAAEILERLRAGPAVRVPLAVALRDGDDLVEGARAAGEKAELVTLPPSCAASPSLLERIRAATSRPLVLRLSPLWSDEELDAAVTAALDARLDGCLAVDGAPSPLLPGGSMEGPFLLERALATAEYVARRAGDRLVVIGAGGIEAPRDAVRFLDAGARLVEVGAGFVYAGPGLPRRITEAHLVRAEPRPLPPSGPVQRRPAPLVPEPQALEPAEEVARAPFFSGWLLLLVTGLVLVASGLTALALAATVKLLPNDVHYLGMTVEGACSRNQCRIVHFMAHDRVSWGGSMTSIGIVYVWLAGGPVRRGEAWAWWTFLVSGLIGFASFLTYLGFGYLDRWHAAATLLLLPVFGLGLVGAFAQLRGRRGLGAAIRVGAPAWLWSPAGMGRACFSFSAFGMIAGGLTIMVVGMTQVFVPQDLEYMGLTASEIAAIHPRLVSLIAHDRAGFGGGLCSGGVAIMLSLWCGARPGARGLWLALTLSGIVGFSTAIGVHPAVGYTSFTHLLPAYFGALAFVAGSSLLRRPLLEPDRPAARFPDL